MFKVGNSQYTDLVTFKFRWLAVSPVTSLLQFSLLTYYIKTITHTFTGKTKWNTWYSKSGQERSKIVSIHWRL